MEEELVRRAGLPYTAIPAGQVAGMGLKTLPNLVKVARGTLASRRILNDFKPDVLLFTGGFVAVPMALAASGLPGMHVPSVVYVPDIEPGIALKLIARYADVIAVTTENSRPYFSSNKRTVVTGYPLRPELSGWTRSTAVTHLGLQPGRFTLLITGGSKGAQSLNKAVFAIVPELLKEMQVVHLTGRLDQEEAEQLRKSLPANLAAQYHVMAYLHEMGAALASADLVISRAGASVLGEYPLFGLPAILVPYPYAWRYQKVNADYLTQRGAALMIETERLAAELLPTAQSLARDPDRLRQMRQSMQSLERPHAAQHIADLVRELAENVRGTGAQSPGERKHG